MSFWIRGHRIFLTRGDSFSAEVNIFLKNGEKYIPQEGDKIRFAMKKSFREQQVLLEKEIPNDSLILRITAEETKKIPFGDYIYDIQIILEDGTVDTFISDGQIRIGGEIN